MLRVLKMIAVGFFIWQLSSWFLYLATEGAPNHIKCPFGVHL